MPRPCAWRRRYHPVLFYLGSTVVNPGLSERGAMPAEPLCPRLLMETRCEREQLTSLPSCRSIVRHVPKLSLLAHARSSKAPEHCQYRQIANVARVLRPLADVLRPDYSYRFYRNDFRDHCYVRLYKKSSLDDSVRYWPRMPGSLSA